jgi:hypothetical protein
MAIPIEYNFKQLEDWLNEKLDDKKSIIACCQEVNIVPETKGIYFWFIHPDGYNALSNYHEITPIKSKYKRNINGTIYDLIYLGTAGTGKKGNSQLLERLKWHLCQKHYEKTICKKNSALSTLRTGISSLISEDLIDNDTEKKVNDFFREYMLVFWVIYEGIEINNIDSDEKHLIKEVRPLINIKNNPNAKSDAIDNSTKAYRGRRNLVTTKTKQRLGYKGEEEKIMKKQNPSEFAISYEERIVTDDKHCIEYTVLQGEDIAVVTRGIYELPTSEVIIKIFDSKNPVKVFDLWTFGSTGNDNNPNAQNIFNYFSNSAPDKLKEKSEENNFKNIRTNWINWWMIENKIEEITVRICSKNKKIQHD